MMHSRLCTIGAWLLKRRLRLVLLFVGVLLPLLVAAGLAREIAQVGGLAFDRALLLFLRGEATPLLDRAALFLSIAGSRNVVLTVDLVVVLVLAVLARWRDAVFWIFAVGGAGLLNVAGKQAFGRIRPDLWPSIAPESSYSFPSGHSMQTMAFLAALLVLLRQTRWRVWALVVGVPFVLLVGLSRVYLGVHYPSDVLAGWAAALAWVMGLNLIMDGPRKAPRERGGV